MIMVKRLTQPPRPSWAVWDTAMPELCVNAYMSEEEWAAVRHSSDAIYEAVRAKLQEAQATLADMAAQLEEL